MFIVLRGITFSLSFVWFYQCLSVKICCISPSNSEGNRDGADAESPFPSFFSFSASFKNSSQKSENCLRFATGGLNLCLYPILSRNKFFFFARKKNSGDAICSR